VFKKNDDRTIYNVVYRDGKSGIIYMKRCAITGLTRDKEYDLTQGNEGSKILYMSANPNGEAETLKIALKPRPRIKNLVFDSDLSDLAIKGKSSIGNILTRFPVHRIELKEKGISTLSAKKLWWNETVMRLNEDERGTYLGEFSGADKLIVFTRSGLCRLSSFDLSNHFEDDLLMLHKYMPGKVYSAVYFDGEQGYYYIKRFSAEPSEKPTLFIDEHPKSNLVLLSEQYHPRIEIRFGGKHKNRDNDIIDVSGFIAVKGYKAKGKRLTTYEVKEIIELEPTNFLPAVDETSPEPDDKPVQESPAIAEKPGRPEEPGRPEKRGKSERQAKSEKPAKVEKPGKPERIGKLEGSGKPEGPAKPEKSGKSEESDRPDGRIKSEKPIKAKESGKHEETVDPGRRSKPEGKAKAETLKKPEETNKSGGKGKPKKPGKPEGPDSGEQMSLF